MKMNAAKTSVLQGLQPRKGPECEPVEKSIRFGLRHVSICSESAVFLLDERCHCQLNVPSKFVTAFETTPGRLMAGILRFFLCILILFLVVSSPQARESAVIDLTILHINDFHGNLLSKPGKEGKPGTGGMAWIAKMVSDERAKNPEGTLLPFGGGYVPGDPHLESLPRKVRH